MSALSFANPLGLALLGSIAVLALFYLRRRRRLVQIVPSLMLWESLRQEMMRARRFRPNWLFVLQLITLAALSGALAQPYLAGLRSPPEERRRVLLIDTTASTQARDLRPSRFAVLQQQALARLAEAGTSAEVGLISAGRRPKVELPPTTDHAAIAARIAQLAPADTGGDLRQAMQLAADLVPDATIDLFTDANGAAPIAPHWPAGVDPLVVGESDDNLGIVSLEVLQERFDELADARVTVQVKNYGRRERHVLLTVAVGEDIVLRQGLTLAAGALENVVVRDLPHRGQVTAALEGGDALPADDVAYGWLATLGAPTLRLIAPPSRSALSDDLVALCQRLNLRVEVGAPGTDGGAADLIIYDQVVPPRWPASNALFLFPARGSPLFQVHGEVEHAEVLDWNQQHPVFAALQPLPSLPFARARIVDTPPWAEELLWSRTDERQFALAFAGEQEGYRLAVLTFDLHAEGLLANDRIDRVMLFAAFLAWLLPPGDDALVARAGQAVRLPSELDGAVVRSANADIQPNRVLSNFPPEPPPSNSTTSAPINYSLLHPRTLEPWNPRTLPSLIPHPRTLEPSNPRTLLCCS